MKKNLLIALLVIFTGSISVPASAGKAEDKKLNSTAVASPESNESVKKLSDEEINCLVSRLDEIRDMDRKQLSRADKKALKQEVKDIKEILKEQDYVIYVSLTALLLILLLIILL